ncbi:hypothetical protein AX769_12340 [Frondihabitans sp. PAMC 28766]|uniref:glycerophosphodiester phosphodiesterase n=1 Tax=Frondihabitans sp. PAMC 28766 TaxID=1795630 RepID=UPI00078CA265|nr:glycerophosphodiester phosphodiesterase [Frondihabitans sp. PAMC 28766]AMM20786.1 hypothetical protein AX769_12340 [Frondihabitans sp. PAMC 28766]
MSDWFTAAPPRVIAHRGLATQAPENTLLAFVQAISLGVTHLETDVHASRDGVAIISHDPDFGRLSGDSTPIASRTRDELRHVHLGRADTPASERQDVATLADALDAFPDAFFNIDLKAEAVVEPAVRAITAAKAVERVLVTSFDDNRRRRAVAALPGVATSPGSRGVLTAALAGRLHLPPLSRRVLHEVDALQIPETFRGVKILTPALISQAHEAGVEVHVWTVNAPADMERLLGLGVDGLITDRADLAVEVLARRSPADR